MNQLVDLPEFQFVDPPQSRMVPDKPLVERKTMQLLDECALWLRRIFWLLLITLIVIPGTAIAIGFMSGFL